MTQRGFTTDPNLIFELKFIIFKTRLCLHLDCGLESLDGFDIKKRRLSKF